MAVHVDIDYDSVKDATEGIEGLVQRIYANRRHKIAEAFIEVVTPFVPMKTGALRNSATIVDDGRAVTWHAENENTGYPYGDLQYEVPYSHEYPETDHWDQAAMFYEGDTFIKKCEEILSK